MDINITKWKMPTLNNRTLFKDFNQWQYQILSATHSDRKWLCSEFFFLSKIERMIENEFYSELSSLYCLHMVKGNHMNQSEYIQNEGQDRTGRPIIKKKQNPQKIIIIIVSWSFCLVVLFALLTQTRSKWSTQIAKVVQLNFKILKTFCMQFH